MLNTSHNIFTKLSCTLATPITQRLIHTTARRDIQLSQILCGEPLKKKKKLDPAIIKLQVERRKKRLEKQIKKAQRFGRKLKPVDELEVHRLIAKNAPPRSALETEIDAKVKSELAHKQDTLKEWMVYRSNTNKSLHAKFSEMLASQEKALSELKLACPSLYDQAVQIDEELVPVTFNGPVETPPIPNYLQDGVYRETTRSYEMNPEIVKLMLDKNHKSRKI